MTPAAVSPEQILDKLYEKGAAGSASVIDDYRIRERVHYVCDLMSNRAGVRMLMACLLAKLDHPSVDPRKPYTQIGGTDSFSGRSYDERYLTGFINKHGLPCNSTTAFLTPTYRNINEPLTPNIKYEGRPRELYQKVAQLLEDVAKGKASAQDVFVETIRRLIYIREEKKKRMASLLKMLKPADGALPLSSSAIVTLLRQHLASKNSSRLPVLMVAAAYEAAGTAMGEKASPLLGHNAADEQTGCVGDVEICLSDEEGVVTAYEMKARPVTVDDIDHAATKIEKSDEAIDNYLFITTSEIDPDIAKYAAAYYDKLGGVEIAVLDCITFMEHFLHLFHRVRGEFVDAYQRLVLGEPDSAVSQSLKEAFLALRQTAESGG